MDSYRRTWLQDCDYQLVSTTRRRQLKVVRHSDGRGTGPARRPATGVSATDAFVAPQRASGIDFHRH